MRISPWRAALLGIVATVAGSGLIATTTSVAHAQKNHRLCVYVDAEDYQYRGVPKKAFMVVDYKKEGACPKIDPVKLAGPAGGGLSDLTLNQKQPVPKIRCEDLDAKIGGNWFGNVDGKGIDVCTKMVDGYLYEALADEDEKGKRTLTNWVSGNPISGVE